MRIIAGKCKGRRLSAVKGMETRPTADRVKEAVFSVIGSRVVEARILDVFAGTGSIALEALSRGAGYALLFEKSGDAAKIIAKNISDCGFEENSKLLRGDSLKNLSLLKDEKFEIIYIDPPYQSDLLPKALKLVAEKGLLAQEGLLITETQKNISLPDKAGNILLKRETSYGDTKIGYYCYPNRE